MELTVISSGSRSNCYVIHNENEALIIEAGAKLIEVKKVLDFDISKVVGCVISHEHSDHSKYVAEYLEASIPVRLSEGTNNALRKMYKKRFALLCEHGVQFNAGNFTILPFDVQHDANQPFGFLIKHPEAGKILFLTDTYFSDYVFSGLNHILVEANYSDHILQENIQAGRVHPSMKNRLLGSHMSLATTKELLSANDLTNVVNIILIHLSDGNSNARQFKEEITAHTGKPVFVADTGLTISLNREGF
jgi:phosphoribosyl 1,2-cyclic phosphodiesterase